MISLVLWFIKVSFQLLSLLPPSPLLEFPQGESTVATELSTLLLDAECSFSHAAGNLLHMDWGTIGTRLDEFLDFVQSRKCSHNNNWKQQQQWWWWWRWRWRWRQTNKQQSHGTSTKAPKATNPSQKWTEHEQLLLLLLSLLLHLSIWTLFSVRIIFVCVYKNWRQENWNDIKWKFQYVRTI